MWRRSYNLVAELQKYVSYRKLYLTKNVSLNSVVRYMSFFTAEPCGVTDIPASEQQWLSSMLLCSNVFWSFSRIWPYKVFLYVLLGNLSCYMYWLWFWYFTILSTLTFDCCYSCLRYFFLWLGHLAHVQQIMNKITQTPPLEYHAHPSFWKCLIMHLWKAIPSGVSLFFH